MTPIRDRVYARPDLDEMRAQRDLDGLVAALNASPEVTFQSRFITARVILTLPNGEDILDALELAQATDTSARYALKFLQQEAGVDCGDPAFRMLVDREVQRGVLQAAWATQIKNLALKPVYVDRTQVEQALYNPDGTEK